MTYKMGMRAGSGSLKGKFCPRGTADKAAKVYGFPCIVVERHAENGKDKGFGITEVPDKKWRRRQIGRFQIELSSRAIIFIWVAFYRLRS